MTREEFEAGYAARSNATVAALRSMGRVVRPCVCGAEGCQGWQSVRVDPDDAWPDDSPYPVSDPRYQR